jgi:hypothetical protein
MDYKFEERMRRIEAVEGSSVRKVRITTNFYSEYGSTMLVSEITNTIYVDNGNSCPGSETWQSPYCSIQGALNAATPGTGGGRKAASASPPAYLPLLCTFLKRPTQGTTPQSVFYKLVSVAAREPPGQEAVRLIRNWNDSIKCQISLVNKAAAEISDRQNIGRHRASNRNHQPALCA